MKPLRIAAIVLCVVSALSLLCLFTADNDALFLPLALSSAVIANVADRCAEKQLQKGEAHD